MIIPVSKPWITDLEVKYATDALNSGWISSNGPYIQKFEEAFAEYIGAEQAVATCNGTAACHIALLASGVRPGDRVLIPATTFVATANAVTYCGAHPIVADIDSETWNMTPYGEADWTFCVHLYGNPCDMSSLSKANLIEDACEAIGTEWRGQKAGTFGKAAAFSFFGNKTLSTGEGGIVVTSDREVASKARLLVGQGQTDRYWHPVVGYNYRMTNIQAAMGLAQVERIEQILAEKQRVYERYKRRIGAIMQKTTTHGNHGGWAVTVRTSSPQQTAARLAENGIETRRVFYPITKLPPYYDVVTTGPCTNAQNLRETGLTLPSYAELADNQIDRICSIVENSVS